MSLGDEDETVSESVVESDEDEDTFDVLAEAIALIESKKFVDGVEWLLADVNELSSYLISLPLSWSLRSQISLSSCARSHSTNRFLALSGVKLAL